MPPVDTAPPVSEGDSSKGRLIWTTESGTSLAVLDSTECQPCDTKTAEVERQRKYSEARRNEMEHTATFIRQVGFTLFSCHQLTIWIRKSVKDVPV